MLYPTELFVVILNLIGLPLFTAVIRAPGLPGNSFFVAAYITILFSNISSILEGFWLAEAFNFLEHAMIALSSLLFLIAIRKFVRGRNISSPSPSQETLP